MTLVYDVTIIGGGPGGYVAAIRASQLGMNVMLVDKESNLGGTCLNVGCIPSKALLHSSQLYVEALNEFADRGIKFKGLELDLKAMIKNKNMVVEKTVKGVNYLIKKNKIDRLIGTGKILKAGEIEVILENGEKKIVTCKNIIIATGSEAINLPGVKLDEKKIISSTAALQLHKVPKSMVIIGAGAIGLEIGSIWRRLGAEVTVVEFLDRILFNMDEDISNTMFRILKAQGLKFELESKVAGLRNTESGVIISIEPESDGKLKVLKSDVVLIAIGRRPHTVDLGLENIGIIKDDRGFIIVDDQFKTNVKGIYAIGDVIGGAMLAHKAEDEGIIVAEILAGQSGDINYSAIPTIVYTWPEVAGFGKTEKQLKDDGIKYNVGKIPFSANPRARILGDSTGFVKILADSETDTLLGVHIIGPFAGELIQECVVTAEFGGTAEDIARICHGHPGLCEVIKEAALSVDNRSLHT